MLRGTVLCALLLSAGCGSFLEEVRERAAFDLNCPAAKLEVRRVGVDAIGATGCDRRASYVETCSGTMDMMGMAHGLRCRWIASAVTALR